MTKTNTKTNTFREGCKRRGLALELIPTVRALTAAAPAGWACPDFSQTCGASDPEKRPRTQKSGSALFRPPGLGIHCPAEAGGSKAGTHSVRHFAKCQPLQYGLKISNVEGLSAGPVVFSVLKLHKVIILKAKSIYCSKSGHSIK